MNPTFQILLHQFETQATNSQGIKSWTKTLDIRQSLKNKFKKKKKRMDYVWMINKSK